MELELRRFCGAPPECQVPQSLGDTQQLPQPESPSPADQSSRKRWCASHQKPSTLTRQAFSTSAKPPSAIWNDLQQREFEEAEKTRELERLEASEPRDTPERTTRAATLVTRYNRTEDHQPLRNERSTLVSKTEAEGRNKTGFDAASSANAVLRQRPRDGFRRDPDSSSKRMLYTKAAIALRKGMVELGRVKIDGNSVHNLLPRSIADELGLSLHFGGTIRIRVENRSIPISQYCRFSIQVAGVETTINTCVVSELPSLLLGRAWIREVRLLRDFENHTYYIPGPFANLNELPEPASTTEADTDFVMEEREEAPVAEELPTAAEAGECELGELASTYESIDSATGDETISEDEIWEDSVSHQSSEGNIYSVDRILAEKQEGGRTYYLILWDGYTEDQSTWEPLQNIRDKALLDIWRERKVQELRAMVPAFDLVNFEKRRRERLGLALRERRSKLQMKRVGMPELFF